MTNTRMVKAVVLIGGPQKGTRFRPLSMDILKPLFPVAGFPMIYHHIDAARKIKGLREILLIGSYQQSDALHRFIMEVQHEFRILIRYLQEYAPLGTGGALYHFRDQILAGNPEVFFVMNCDVCCDFPLAEMLEFHKSRGPGVHHTILGTNATRQQSLNYGCIVEDSETHRVRHYVEKPETFVSTTINCGVYIFSPDIFNCIAKQLENSKEAINFDLTSTEQNPNIVKLDDAIAKMTTEKDSNGIIHVYHTIKFWSQIKSAGAAVFANRHYLSIYHRTHPERLAKLGPNQPNIIGDVFIHATARVDPTATLGPNVTIGSGVTIGAGVRVRETLILDGAIVGDHACILYTIIGPRATIGQWTRIEGTANDPNPNKPFAKLDVCGAFSNDGRLQPSITVIGSSVFVPSEVVILNSIVLPNKELRGSFKNQIIL
ncbi:DgyrCDS12886 [Dimorphilus gyrociliatus]|uniref:DgyrCDS12886 n=1 Tax=Dimorphilus gyrociliatus TaxID=2664684 RepID=A0A7I8W910_9ANNE|nr:DgyrCDS12886 [Dimorphilus gyrociliatus]